MKDYLKIEPEKLVEKIAKPRLVVCLCIAFVVTCVLLGGLSVPFIIECVEYDTIYPVKVKRDIEKAEKEAQEAEAKKQKEEAEKAAAKKKAEEKAEKEKQAAEQKERVSQELAKQKDKKSANASQQNQPAAQPQNTAGTQADDDVAIPTNGPSAMDFGTM